MAAGRSARVSSRAEHPEMTSAANHLMRRALHEIDRVRALAARDAEEVRNLRDSVRKTLIELERDARAHVNAFAPLDVGEELRLDMKHKFKSDLPGRRDPQPPPTRFDAAREEWTALAGPTEQQVGDLISARTVWEHKVIKRRRSMPTIPADLWNATERLIRASRGASGPERAVRRRETRIEVVSERRFGSRDRSPPRTSGAGIRASPGSPRRA